MEKDWENYNNKNSQCFISLNKNYYYNYIKVLLANKLYDGIFVCNAKSNGYSEEIKNS